MDDALWDRVWVCLYSGIRYLYAKFYLRNSMEFFLDGHIEAYKEIEGEARENWYDNLKSVVIRRRPELVLNAQFLEPGDDPRRVVDQRPGQGRGDGVRRHPNIRFIHISAFLKVKLA